MTPSAPVYPLGRLQVRRSGYGAMQLAGQFAAGTPPDRATAMTVLRAAVAAGVDHIDTAQYYGPGTVNALIRDALYPYPAGLAIVSKVAAGPGASDLRAGIEDNLRALRVSQLAAVNLRLAGGGRVDAHFDDQLASMIAARDEGLIAGIGLSNVSLDAASARRGPDQHRLRAEPVPPRRPQFGSAARRVPHPRHRVRAVLPARLAPRAGQPGVHQPGGPPDGRPARGSRRPRSRCSGYSSSPRTCCSSPAPGRSPICRQNLAAEDVTLDSQAVRDLDSVSG